ncbi:hypothetical protein [Georgenia sp. AZ-5]|uniref:hypothetical protein n=1 Tax=Georgenia sp. AZ-5 TaxID=3367526 RepID=UPI00375496AE
MPGPRQVWVIAWAAVPWLNVAAIVVAGAAPWAATGVPAAEVFNRVAVTSAVLLSLWGAARISRELRRLQLDLSNVVDQDAPDVERLFRGVDSVAGPIGLVLAVGIVLPLDEALRGEPAAAILQGVTWLVIGIPLGTALWAYLVLQAGLVRLGRGHLTLQGYHGDRSLDLRSVGEVAFTAFWMLFGSVGPLVLTAHTDRPGALVGTIVLAVGLVLFFLSLRDVHRQMVLVKRRELDRARLLYQEAYRRVQHEPTLEMLQQQSGLLGAAEALEKRAERIQEWPFNEATFARVVTIASSASAAILARLVLTPAGL